MKKIFSIIITFIFCIFMTGVCYASDSDILEKAKQSVMRIFIPKEFSDDGKHVTSYGSGSAFCIGVSGEPVEYLITAAHCILDDAGNIESDIYVYASDINSKRYKVEVIAKSPEYDYAVLRTTEEKIVERVPIKLSETPINIGDIIYSVGFPGVIDKFDDNPPTASINNINISEGKIVSTSVPPQDFFRTSSTVSGGDSGGLVMDEHGYAIGVTCKLEKASSEIGDIYYSQAAKISNILSALDAHDIRYMKATDFEINSNTSIDDQQSYLQSEGGITETVIEHNNELNLDNQSTTHTLLYISLSVLVIIIILFIFLHYRSRRAHNNLSSNENNKEIDSIITKSSFNATKTFISEIKYDIMINDRHYTIGSKKAKEDISIGTSEANVIKVSSVIKGVSGNHCHINIDENSIITITDDKSRFGTTVLYYDETTGKEKKVNLGKEKITIKVDFGRFIAMYLGGGDCCVRIRRNQI